MSTYLGLEKEISRTSLSVLPHLRKVQMLQTYFYHSDWEQCCVGYRRDVTTGWTQGSFSFL
jgi:hypothetical protein